MVSQLMWSSLDNLSTAYTHIWPSPIEWSSKEKKILHNSLSVVSQRRRMIPWIIAVLFLIGILIPLYTIVIASHLYGLAKIPMLPLSISILMFLFIIFGVLSDLGLQFYTRDAMTAFNYFRKMEASLVNGM